MIKTNEQSESGLELIDSLLTKQQSTTAVERFAQRMDALETPALQSHYRELIPLEQPQPGEQYAFEVDLDACSGCKACVAACHNLNGLEDNELWRNVGQLIGGSPELPVIQHVTASCHHCLDPACMNGCPVNAYEKDETTGIVKHLDDQCIGCQYCVFMCPYDVPTYNPAKGIVRKCDMCSSRLREGEAPACVQACPNQAIRIRVVSNESVMEASESSQLVPGAPDPGLTLPTTLYKTDRAMPRNLLPEDYFTTKPQHAHWPLVAMLVLTQMSLGAFAVGQFLIHGPWSQQILPAELMTAHFTAALILGFIGLGAAIFHLGRPQFAYRAMAGLRTSWLSREILAFNVFAGLATNYTACYFVGDLLPFGQPMIDGLGLATVFSGVAAVACSVILYVKTGRPMWTAARTAPLFFLSAAVQGIPVALFVSLVACPFTEEISVFEVMQRFGNQLCIVLAGIMTLKLLIEASIFAHLADRKFNPLKQSAILMTGDLGTTTLFRFAMGVIGGIAIPLHLSQNVTETDGAMFVMIVVAAMYLFVFLGELGERTLFFATSVARRMPGSPNN